MFRILICLIILSPIIGNAQFDWNETDTLHYDASSKKEFEKRLNDLIKWNQVLPNRNDEFKMTIKPKLDEIDSAINYSLNIRFYDPILDLSKQRSKIKYFVLELQLTIWMNVRDSIRDVSISRVLLLDNKFRPKLKSHYEFGIPKFNGVKEFSFLEFMIPNEDKHYILKPIVTTDKNENLISVNSDHITIEKVPRNNSIWDCLFL